MLLCSGQQRLKTFVEHWAIISLAPSVHASLEFLEFPHAGPNINVACRACSLHCKITSALAGQRVGVREPGRLCMPLSLLHRTARLDKHSSWTSMWSWHISAWAATESSTAWTGALQAASRMAPTTLWPSTMLRCALAHSLQSDAPAKAKLTTDACQAAKVLATLHGHTGRVNCVRWLEPAGASVATRHVAEPFHLVHVCACKEALTPEIA